MGILSKINRKRKKAQKKITKPLSRFLGKVIPNEIKPFLPYAAALAPFMLPPGFGSGFASGLFKTQAAQQMAARGLLSGAANIGSQLAQEGNEGEISGLSALLAAGTGALTAPGAGDFLSGMTTKAGLDPALGSSVQGDILANRSFLTKVKDLGLTGASKAADFLSVARDSGGVGDILRPGGTKVGLNMATAQAASVPLTQGTTDLAVATARKALKDYEDELAEYERITGEAQTASDDARRTAIRAAMIAGNHSEDVITETLALLGLKDGGRVGLREGGMSVFEQITQLPAASQNFIPGFGRPGFRPLMAAGQMPVFPRLRQLEQGIDTAESDLGSIRSRLGNQEGRLGGLMAIQPEFGLARQLPLPRRIEDLRQLGRGPGGLVAQNMKNGGMTGLKDGGMLDLDGKEMDLRGGGFVPIGKKERADDVPARLSKNEFVMTADAVRAAGGGNINEGAKRMYETMNKLEARA